MLTSSTTEAELDNLLRTRHATDTNDLFRLACSLTLTKHMLARIMVDDKFQRKYLYTEPHARELFNTSPSEPQIRMMALIRSFLTSTEPNGGGQMVSLFESLLKIKPRTLYMYVPSLRMSTLKSIVTRFYSTYVRRRAPAARTMQELYDAFHEIYHVHIVSHRIGRGTYGVVFRPPLLCEGELRRTHVHACGKVMARKKGSHEKDMVRRLQLSEADPLHDHHATLLHTCTPTYGDTVAARDQQLLQSMIPENPTMLIYEFGGVPLTAILASHRFQRQEIIQELHRLLCWTLDLNSRGRYHMDIKAENIVCSVQRGKLKCRLIDFGLAAIVEELDIPPPSRLYTAVYTWPFEIMLYGDTNEPLNLRINKYARRFAGVDFKTICNRFEPVYTWIQQRPRPAPTAKICALVREIFSYSDAFQFCLLLSNPFLMGCTNQTINTVIEQSDYANRPTLERIMSHACVADVR
jgi:hypothetical protein